MNKKKILNESTAVEIISQIITGYEELIRNNIVHRDIKPENILVHNGTFKLSDFGFAVRLKNKTDCLKSVPMGTLNYCSPQVMKQEVIFN